MKILLGIIAFHVLVIIRAKLSDEDNVPFISTAVITLLLTIFVAFMMFEMEEPIP
ncbi:MAG: hypothetical protein WD059_13885 [Balneolaceae bacterium]